jgi:hypothetical protein
LYCLQTKTRLEFDDEYRSRFKLLYRINEERDQYQPFYGYDTLQQIQLAMQPCQSINRTTFSGYATCQRIVHDRSKERYEPLSMTDVLDSLIRSTRDILDDYRPIHDR